MRVLGALLFLGVLVAPSVARAGCPNLCEISQATFTLEPELACANVRAVSSDCDCGIYVEIGNECELPLDALSFEFESCGSIDGAFDDDCRQVPPGEQGTFEEEIHELGRTERRFTLRYDGSDHVLTVAADVSSFDDGALCSVTGGAGRGGASGWVWLLAVAGALAWQRRARRS